MNEEEIIDNLIRDITKAGFMPKSEVKQRIQSLLSLHDKKLAEKVRGMKDYPANEDSLFEQERINHTFNQALDLAAQVIEGKEQV